MRIAMLIALLPILSGCIAFPTFERSEFREETLSFIEPGVTTRAQLEAQLVHDQMLVSERSEGRLVVYADFRSTAVVGDAYTADTLGARDYLVVEYDDEQQVVRFEALKGSGSCTSSEVCVRNGVTEHGPDQLGLLVFATPGDDETAKSFDVPTGSCNIHAWATPTFLCPSRGGARISLDSEASEGWVGFAPRAYLRWTVAAPESGTTDISIEAIDRLWRLQDKPPSTHTVQCTDGSNVFVELDLQCNAFGIRRGFEFRIVSDSEGRAAIQERQLILN